LFRKALLIKQAFNVRGESLSSVTEMYKRRKYLSTMTTHTRGSPYDIETSKEARASHHPPDETNMYLIQAIEQVETKYKKMLQETNERISLLEAKGGQEHIATMVIHENDMIRTNQIKLMADKLRVKTENLQTEMDYARKDIHETQHKVMLLSMFTGMDKLLEMQDEMPPPPHGVITPTAFPHPDYAHTQAPHVHSQHKPKRNWLGMRPSKPSNYSQMKAPHSSALEALGLPPNL